MTNIALPITFKCPPDLAERLPAPGKGRSRFIVETLRERLSAMAEPRGWGTHAQDMAAMETPECHRSAVADDRAREEAR
ncbi:MAG: hypothetical protein EBS05_17065 [Proteobacteria bacterium]|nr:hypothetical protein [Pseudomonadota bacterium]